MESKPEILTPSEAAELLRLSESQLYELTRHRARSRHTRPIPVIYAGKHLRFARTALLEWANAGGSRD